MALFTRSDRVVLTRFWSLFPQLKSYRAKQSKNSSTASSADTKSRPVSGAFGHTHRRSISKSMSINPIAANSQGVSAGNHSRRSSKRISRGSISSFAGLGHGHTRSRASISLSVSAPTTAIEPSFAHPSTPPRFEEPLPHTAPLAGPSTWSARNGFNTSPVNNYSAFRRSSTTTGPSASDSHSLEKSANVPAPTSAHNRRSSRHSRRISVSNFRESMELVSGQGTYTGALQPNVGSFAASSSASHDVSPGRSPSPTWSSDPAKVLQALKERGRRETEEEEDQEITRLNALEALEGRLAAPSEMIDLGNEAEGQLLFAPPSPGYTAGAPAHISPTPTFAPVFGLGLGNTNGNSSLSAKRNSWSLSGPVTAAGAKGAMDLGMLIEEEEEEEEEQEDEDEEEESAVQVSKKVKSPPRRRPKSLLLPPHESDSIAIENSAGPEVTPPPSASFAARPMRLSLCLSSAGSSFAATPSTATYSPFVERPSAPLRSLTLGSTPTSAPTDEAKSPASDRRRHSLFHSTAAANANAGVSHNNDVSYTPPSAGVRGLRSLSIGSSNSASSPNDYSRKSPVVSRANSYTSANATPPGPPSRPPPTQSNSRRSSISYRNSSIGSLASPDGPLSAQSQAARRPWRTSISNASVSSTSSAAIPVSAMSGFGAFPFAPSHGTFGGFGDLEVDNDNEGPDSPLSLAFSQSATSYDHMVPQLNSQISTLRLELEQLQTSMEHQATVHSMEMHEFEKRASEEARSLRIRISELTSLLEEARVGRRFEVDGLSREVEQAREAIADLSEERDSLVEDVEGWRSRCATLEHSVKKEKEEELMSKAQAKLIGEMRDQMMGLVAALAREKGEHAESREEVARLLVQKAVSPSVDEEESSKQSDINLSRHNLKNTSDVSAVSTSSFGHSLSGNTTESTSIGTDFEDNYGSKASSPLSAHSSFSGSKGRAADFPAVPAAGGLQTLPEEDGEVEEEQAESPISDRVEEGERLRLGSGSTGSTGDSDAMPMTPNKDSPAPLHDRSDSFVRHWSVSHDFLPFLSLSLTNFVTSVSKGKYQLRPTLGGRRTLLLRS